MDSIGFKDEHLVRALLYYTGPVKGDFGCWDFTITGSEIETLSPSCYKPRMLYQQLQQYMERYHCPEH
jgi:hypothetical protein